MLLNETIFQLNLFRPGSRIMFTERSSSCMQQRELIILYIQTTQAVFKKRNKEVNHADPAVEEFLG